MQEIDLLDMVREVLLVSRGRLSRAGNESAGSIAVELTGSVGVRVRGIASELREVVTNLVGNAIDAMPAGGTLSVDVRRVEDVGRFSVRDSGVGMTPEVVKRIFEPFFSTKGEKGNGLGLSIVEGIVRRHGGQISVNSAPGSGSEFRVELPAIMPAIGTEEWLRSKQWTNERA
jgi:signal transduction histidine kinase